MISRGDLARRLADLFGPLNWGGLPEDMDVTSLPVIVNAIPHCSVTFGQLADECIKYMREQSESV